MKTSQTLSRTLTLGLTYLITPTQANEFRFNLTQNTSSLTQVLTNLGGAVPFDFSTLLTPSGQPATTENTQLGFNLSYGGSAYWYTGRFPNSQRQYGVLDTYAWSQGRHQFKVGVDWRRLTTLVQEGGFVQNPNFFSEGDVLSNSSLVVVGYPSVIPLEPVYHNFSTFAQDEWKTTPRLALSLGLRWDINPPPGNLNGPLPYTVDQVTDLSRQGAGPLYGAT